MRPGTLSGIPAVEDHPPPPVETSPPDLADGPGSTPVGPPRKGITAEYGAMVGSSSPPMAASVPGPEESAAAMERMRTQPKVRKTRHMSSLRRGSRVPTEEVPSTEPAEDSEQVDDDAFETKPRITMVPQAVSAPEPSTEAESGPEDDEDAFITRPRRTGGAQLTTQPTSESMVTTEAAVRRAHAQARTSPPDPAPSSPPSTPALDIPTPGARASRDRIAYEDTLRYERPEDEGEIEIEIEDARATVRKADTSGPSIDPDLELQLQEVLDQAENDRERRGLDSLVDILEYRELRLRSLRGEAIDKTHYAELERRLQHQDLGHDSTASMRRYQRFACSFRAQLTHHRRGCASTVTVEVLDLSAGGAKVLLEEYTIDAGEIVWLAFDLTQANREGTLVPAADTVVFKARVVWTRRHEAQVGLIFAGAPRYGDDVVVDVDA